MSSIGKVPPNVDNVTTQLSKANEVTVIGVPSNVVLKISNLPAGSSILLYEDMTQHSQTVANSATSIGATFNVPVNTYSYIEIESWGMVVFTTTSTIQAISIVPSAGGNATQVKPATSDIVTSAIFIPWYSKVLIAITAGATVTMNESSSAADANTTVYQNGFVVRGIV